jgi:exo-1,4-beta-D-glucosaminidase
MTKKKGIFISVILFGLFNAVLSTGVSCETSIHLKNGWFMQSAYLVGDGGEKISSKDFKPEGWYKINIPTTVLNTLVINGIYPDPYIGMNNMKIPDASEEFNQKYDLSKFTHLPDGRNPWLDPYWFRTEFTLPNEFEDKFLWLNVEAINYRAEVWLNGHKIADKEEIVGMFCDWLLNITEDAVFGDENILAVKIYPLDYPGLPDEPQLKAFGPFGLNGGPTGDIGKNVTMHCSVGWDWLPAVRDRDMGIWQDVFITATGPVDIRHPHVVADFPSASMNKAELTISAELVNLSGLTQTGKLIINLSPKYFPEETIQIEKDVIIDAQDMTIIELDKDSHPELFLNNPKLWWPNGYGAPNLYDIKMSLVIEGIQSDFELFNFGIRKIESKVTIVDEWARRDFFINSKKIMIKGGAWVPDMMLNRSREKLYNELRLSKEANLNIVRIWGGGATPPEDFFSFCDELGLLVWHDFWITGDCQGTWGKGSQDYPYDTEAFLNNARKVVLKLRNHPSLLVWTAGNEGLPRQEIYVPLRDEILAGLDGTRPFLPSSGYREPPADWGLSWPDNMPAGTYSGGPYYWVDPTEYYQKVREGKDWLFKNEVGIPSVPVLDSLKKFIKDITPDPEVKFPLNDTWGYHDACEGNGKYSLYDQAIRERYGEPNDLADYLQKAQLINAENYRAIFEAVNNAMDRTAGVILWKTNPAWPSVIWQLYDWYLCPNAGYYYTQKACEALHIQLNLDDMSVSAVNQGFIQQDQLRLKAEIFNGKSRQIWSKQTVVDLDPQTSKKIFKLNPPEKVETDIFFVFLEMKDKSGQLISDNFYWLSENNDFTSLEKMSKVRLEVKLNKEIDESTGEIICRIHLSNPSHHLAFFINTSIRKGQDGEEVLPSFWSENYINILPGKTKELTVRFSQGLLDGQTPFLKIEGWNFAPKSIKIE